MSKKPYDQVYYETLFYAVDAAIKEYTGIIKLDNDNFCDHGFQPMDYEKSQSHVLPGVKLVSPHKNKACGLYVNVYRMRSGRYEVCAYVTL